MFVKIDQDHSRFKQIIRGRIKKELRKFISQGELIGKQGKKLISIPVPYINIPHFSFETRQKAGVGQGDGDVGSVIGVGDDEGDGSGNAGNAPGAHILEVDITLDELAEILGEELELPKIEPRGEGRLTSAGSRYTGISTAGPESLRHFKRTFRQALKRQVLSGEYDPQNPRIIPVLEDRRYRVRKEVFRPEHKAVVIYMMDVSGSMGDMQKEIVRVESFWIDTWLRSQYQGIESRYIVHDAVAHEVDQETFYHTRESGGTIISSAYRLCLEMIEKHYSPLEWNIYPFHFSDGDNWSGNDTQDCLKLLENDLMPRCNVFCYGQVESEYGSGQFIKDLDGKFKGNESLITSKIPSKEAIYDSIKDFLGKGK
ncbi:MAG: hypothetical protein A3I75_05410 [Deltaproteobacteria bacterium RIFCSPLOWO2_02_FULL_50_16]|nr:MAG: hypothetical protein A3B79_02385 [Deltaproteobacteria bacterium RIFCSPHIGHO2_02_FULL_50_15]OGQ58156.1 MAG: hypothetical protein A3I75_05410 [Deltaproteobacteria bacterium RIFCSPLOWO2_02_FULL_50_16]OGQ66481.1 MAG: hypothetical protein A3F89_05445 [Deltaproteobacteria bacterium RIFCSPLOWO2_12_FULL_50_11]